MLALCFVVVPARFDVRCRLLCVFAIFFSSNKSVANVCVCASGRCWTSSFRCMEEVLEYSEVVNEAVAWGVA